MAKDTGHQSAEVDEYIDKNLKLAFNELLTDDMPNRLTDLLSALRAHNDESKPKKE